MGRVRHTLRDELINPGIGEAYPEVLVFDQSGFVRGAHGACWDWIGCKDEPATIKVVLCVLRADGQRI